MKTLYTTTLATPVGEFSFAVDANGAVVATTFGNDAALRRRLPGATLEASAERTARARREIEAYFKDPATVFTVPLAPQGTPFQHRVWGALRRIPAGETRTYGQLAAELGSSPRAVGQANATNRVCLFVPCHRVIGADGALTGFAFGEALKRRLLEHEGALAPAIH